MLRVCGTAEALAGGSEGRFWFCSRGWVCWFCHSWSCQPSALFFSVAEHPPVLRAGLAGLTQMGVVFVNADYCPPAAVLGLKKGFLEQELRVNLVTSAWPYAGV